MPFDSAVCFEFFTSYPVSDYLPGIDGNVGIGGIVLGFIYFCNAVITLYWIHQQQRKALKGMEGAAKHVIFPIYLPFLWMSAISDSIVGIVIFFYRINYIGENSWNASVAAASIFAIQHFVIEGIAFALMQYGCGMVAARNAAVWALGWGVTTFIVELIAYRDGDTRVSFFVELVWNIVLLAFYFSLWYLPEKWIFRRPSVIFYSRYWVVLRIVAILSLILVHLGQHDQIELVGNCFSAVAALLLFICLKPYIVYKALLMDSKWWQGVARTNSTQKLSTSTKRTFSTMLKTALISTGLRRDPLLPSRAPYSQVSQEDTKGPGNSSPLNTSMQESPQKKQKGKPDRITDPLDGVEVGFQDAQGLAREVDYISTSSVKLLNFAYISLDNKTLLGAGSFSKVYAGKYKTIPVAIKMLFTQDLNPDVVKRCGNEARILTDISPHPNVVNIYGVAVLPPSVCLVLEICEYGSLSDVLRGMNGGGVCRAALSLSYADRMYLARGCAKGLQALHNYSPDLCHRDIKSMNFLIDGQLNAKVCDLELGGIRDKHHRLSSDIAPTDLSVKRQGQKRENYAMDMNITWQAPEILLGQQYTQESDIYSLALVLWEIVSTSRNSKFSSVKRQNSNTGNDRSRSGSNSPVRVTTAQVSNTPYSECKSQFEIREKVIRGFRPNIPAPFRDVHTATSRDSVSSVNSQSGAARQGEVDPLYVDLLIMGWHQDPNERPDIDQVVKTLNRCWLNSVHRSIYETEYIVDLETIQEENLKLTLLRDFKASASGNSSIVSRNSGGILLGHSLSRAPPSAAVMATLSVMQSELNWSNLEDDNVAYLVVTASSPYFILWATKKFTQLTGFLVNDVIAYDLNILYGPQTNSTSLNDLLNSVLYGNAEHLLTPIYRRDGRAVQTSIHMFPVYDSSRTDFLDTGYPSVDSSPASSQVMYRPGKLSFSARDDPDAGAAQRGNVNDIKALLQANSRIDKTQKADANLYRSSFPQLSGTATASSVLNTIQQNAVDSPTTNNTILNSLHDNAEQLAEITSNAHHNHPRQSHTTSSHSQHSILTASGGSGKDKGSSSSILDWGNSILNVNPFRSTGGGSGEIQGVDNTNPTGGLTIQTKSPATTHFKRVAYITIQFSTIHDTKN